jgi:hypothetical protein
MSPRGFYQREFISPYFTSEKYIGSDQHKAELDSIATMDKAIKVWLGYPRFLWIKGLMAIGLLAKPDVDQDK